MAGAIWPRSDLASGSDLASERGSPRSQFDSQRGGGLWHTWQR